MSDESPVTSHQSPDTTLMLSIRQKWGSAIAVACHESSIPESFLAALIANETGGDPTKSRFEEHVFGEILMVLAGKRAAFGSLGAQSLMATPLVSLIAGLNTVVDMATSWGLTQIMGYQTIPFGKKIAGLRDPQENLTFATVLLTQFAHRFNLNIAANYPELFACWNTGGPHPEKTFDPDYCANGLRRAMLYAGTASPSAGVSA